MFKADNVPIEWEQIDVTGVESGDKHSEELFRESIASLKRNKLGLKGMSTICELNGITLTDRGRYTTYTRGAIRSSVLQRRSTARA